MKATEVLKQYAAGRRDFSGENLRGQSFKGKDFSGANFSKADIQGANFTNAKLIGTYFSGVKAGLERRWVSSLVVASSLLLGLSGLLIGFSGAFTLLFAMSKSDSAKYTGFGTLAVLLVFFLVTLRKGLIAAFITLALTLIFAAAVAFAFITSFYLSSRFINNPLLVLPIINATIGYMFATDGYLSIIIALVLTTAGVCTGAFAAGVIFAAAGATVLTLAEAFVFVGGVVGAFAAVGTLMFAVGGAIAIEISFGLVFAGPVVVAPFSAYIAWYALVGDKKHAILRKIAIASAATGGTSFRNADLTDADFTSATLKSTDFRGANLTRTCWRNAQKLDRVRPGTTYLQFPQVRQLLITGQGQAKTFDRQNLPGVNLQGANLADASFITADLSSANLQDADLSRAKLVQTQLDEADLTGVTLTGAYIEDWGITSHTKLDGVRCEYVFMREPTKEDPNPRRKPDNWNENFSEGDFADFIKPIVDTLDLYHNQDVDPRAIAISFKQLAENHPEADLEIVAMEKRGGNKFLLRAATAPDVERSELSAEYFATYNKLKALAEQELQALLKEKDNRIHSLENMIATALQRPSFYAENYHNQGDTMSETPKSEYNFHSSVGSVANQGHIASSGNENTIGNAAGNVEGDQKTIQHNYAPEQKQTLAEAAAEIQQLLKQLEQTNPTATEAQQIEHINDETTPKFKKRVVGALQATGEAAIDEFVLENKYLKVAKAAIKGWIKPE